MNFDINHPRYSMPGFYLSQVFVAVLGLLIPVLLLRYQGVGFLAVVAFFNALQAWFQLIDFGLGSALSRAFAMCNQPIQYSRQELSVRRGERLLLAAGFLLAIFSAWPLVVIYPEWLGDHSDNRFFMGDTLLVMLLALLSRNQLEFYRAILVGCRQLGWLACVVLGMTLLRVALLLLLIYLNRLSLPVFFGVVVAFNLVEAIWSRGRIFGLFRRSLPYVQDAGDMAPLPWKFSLSMALASLLWIVFSQSDKLYLSRALSTHDFAQFSVATMLAGGIFIIMGPVQNIVASRLSAVYSVDQEDRLTATYRQATHWICLLIFPICAMFTFRAREILWLWTGENDLATHAASILVGYSLGNGLIAVSGLVFYLQFALGRLRWHILGAVLFLLVLLPSMKIGVKLLGFDGAGIVWFLINLLYFVVWLPWVHRRLLRYSYFSWLSNDVLPTVLVAFLICFVFSCLEIPVPRVAAAVQLSSEYLICLILTALMTRDGRALASRAWCSFMKIFEKA